MSRITNDFRGARYNLTEFNDETFPVGHRLRKPATRESDLPIRM